MFDVLKKINYLFLVMIILLGKSVYSKQGYDLAGTKWIFSIVENCDDYLIFNADSSYVEYRCERNEKYFGNYIISKDTVILYQQKGQYDVEEPEDSRHRAGKAKIKLLIINDKLKFIFHQFTIGGTWQPPVTKFKVDIIYERDETYDHNEALKSHELYHILELTASDPIIKERCVDFSKIQKLKCEFVKETVDSLSRCIKLEFYNKQGVLFRALAYLPSIVEYIWTDSSLIEILYKEDGTLLSVDGYMVRPNQVEYLLNDSNITKVKDFYNGKFIDSKICDDCTIDNTVFFLMYSGCKIKFNEKYRMKF